MNTINNINELTDEILDSVVGGRAVMVASGSTAQRLDGANQTAGRLSQTVSMQPPPAY